jgi:hypothetical protein
VAWLAEISRPCGLWLSGSLQAVPIRRCCPGVGPCLGPQWRIRQEDSGGGSLVIGETGRGDPFVLMLTKTSPFTAQGSYQTDSTPVLEAPRVSCIPGYVCGAAGVAASVAA